MKILIVGAGAIGQSLARQLSSERHLVTVVERDARLAQQLSDRVDALVLEGNGGSAAVLERAGIRDTDLLLCVTSADEVNILACMVGKHYNVPTKIARIRDPEYVRDLRTMHKDSLSIEMVINPEQVAASEIARVLRVPVARYVAEFAEGRLLLIGFRARKGSPIVSLPLDELRAMYSWQSFIVCAISRGDALIVPRGDAEIRPDDDVFVMVHRDAANLVNALSGIDRDTVLRKVLILGGGRIGAELARDLEDTGVEVTLIEQDRERCERLTTLLRRVIVVHGDATDIDLLLDSGVETTDGFIATSSDDETNILAGVQVKRMGCSKVIAVTRKPQYSTLITSTALLDTAVNPNMATADAITRHVQAGRVTSLASLGALRASVVEYAAREGASIVGTPLKSLKLPTGSVVAAIQSGDTVRTPGGDDIIVEGDRVIVAVHDTARKDVDALFGRRSWLS